MDRNALNYMVFSTKALKKKKKIRIKLNVITALDQRSVNFEMYFWCLSLKSGIFQTNNIGIAVQMSLL